jgi:hypothetical protein
MDDPGRLLGAVRWVLLASAALNLAAATILWRPVFRGLNFGAVLSVLGISGCASRSIGAVTALTPIQEREMIAAALAGLPWRLRLTAPYCVVIERDGKWSEPDSAWLASLDTARALLPRRACPRTYASMVRLVDSLGNPIGPQRPPGYVDPYQLTVTAPVRVDPERAAVRVLAWQGTQFWLIYCEVYLVGGRAGSCGTLEEGVS